MKKILIAITFSAFLVALLPISAVAEENTAYSITDATLVTDFYQDVLSQPEWETSTNRIERGEMVQLPEDWLKSMDTDTLVEAVIEYPFFVDVYAFDDIQTGVDVMYDTFNGIRELAERSDAGEVILQKYIDEPVYDEADTQTIETDVIIESFVKLDKMEILLAQDFVLNQLNDTELSQLTTAVHEKAEKKTCSPLYGSSSTMFERLISKVDLCAEVETYVYTPNSTSHSKRL